MKPIGDCGLRTADDEDDAGVAIADEATREAGVAEVAEAANPAFPSMLLKFSTCAEEDVRQIGITTTDADRGFGSAVLPQAGKQPAERNGQYTLS